MHREHRLNHFLYLVPKHALLLQFCKLLVENFKDDRVVPSHVDLSHFASRVEELTVVG